MYKALIFTLALSALFLGCNSTDDRPEVDYYITVTESEQYNRLILDFDWLSAYRGNAPGDPKGGVSRTVYLDPTTYSFVTDGTQAPIYMGSSIIETGTVNGYDFYFTGHAVETDDRRIELEKSESILERNPKAFKKIEISRDQPVTVTFVVDIDKSVVPLPDGGAKFVGDISIRVN